MTFLTPEERAEVQRHIEQEYAGVFGPAEIEFHLQSHVGDAFAGYACQVIAPAIPSGSRVLDVVTGFGSFVVLARNQGFAAIGTEVAKFEVDFARRRLQRLRPEDDPKQVFLDGGILSPALDGTQFDAITFWNVLEHIDNVRPILARAVSLLAPGGAIYIVCPNYAAWRNEAHYQIPWRPFLSREAALQRIKEHGKDPRFFETSIFQRTNWGVMAEMKRHGLQLFDRLNLKRMHLGRLVTDPKAFLDFYNPARAAVELAAREASVAMPTAAERLMVLVPDRITDILVKGEYQPNYYNPGELFDEVHIVTTTDDRPDLAQLQRTVGRARLHVHNVPEDPLLVMADWSRWWKKPLRDWARPGVDLAKRIKPQLIRVHGADWNGYLASRIRKALGVPYVLSLHINPDVNPVRRVVKQPLTAAQEQNNRFFDYVEGVGLTNADLVMPVYRSILPYLERHGVSRVEVCYNILNSPFLKQKTDYATDGVFRIVCVGRLFADKNPAHLIRAIAQLPGVALTIVGDGPERPNLEQLARDCHVAERVDFRPAVENDELCKLLPGFDLFAVHTEFWELNKSVLEALLAGLPVVINRRQGPPVPELAGADFVRFVDNTTDSYRDAIQVLMQDVATREALGRRAYAHAQREWAPAVTERKVMDIYRKFMKPAA